MENQKAYKADEKEVAALTDEYNRICEFLHENCKMFRPLDLNIKAYRRSGYEASFLLSAGPVYRGDD
jgi:hypothetical protein